MRVCVARLVTAASMGLAFFATAFAGSGGYDHFVECGRVRMLVSDRGYLRQICVGGNRVIDSVALLASCGDKSVAGKGRVSQSSTFWSASHDVAARGVQIVRDAEHGRVAISREGVLAFGRGKDAKALAYTQRVEVTGAGKMTVGYDVEFLQTLSWSVQPVSVAMHVPTSLAEGVACVMDQRPARTVPATWSKKTQVTGSFRTLELAGLRVAAEEGVRGSLSDPRSWEPSRRSPYQYMAIHKARPWFDGLRPIEKGTKWRIAFTVQLPMKEGPAPAAAQARKAAEPRLPDRSTYGPVVFEDSFDRAALGSGWIGGAFAESAVDRHTRELALAKDRRAASIRDNALDMYHAGKRGKCTILSKTRNIPSRCVLEFDFNLKADDDIGKTLHSMFFRSHSDPGTCICVHVDTRPWRQFWFFEIKHRGRWAGEKLYYCPFRYACPPQDQKFHVRIESSGDSGLLIWITGGGIPANNMPIALLGGREWTPFRDGELFFFSSNRENGSAAHCQWDNLRVFELPPRPTLNELYYRDKLLVGFRDYLFAPKGSWVKVAIRKKQKAEPLAEGAVKPVDWRKSRLLLDIARLPKGRYVVTADLLDKADKPLSAAVIDFHKVRDPKLRPSEMTVHIDGGNRIVVNGKPFFPIGLYCVTLGGARRWTPPNELFAELKAAGFNTVQSYSLGSSTLRRERYDSFVIPWLDAAHKHGLKVYCDIAGSTYPVHRRRGRIRDINDPFRGRIDPLGNTAWALKKLMHHPAILCWYIGDESIGHGEPESYMSRLNRTVKHIDPHHPTVIATCPGGHPNDGLRVTARVADIPANDHYPMFRKQPAHAWRKTAILSQDAAEGLQPWWAIPQCYARNYGREMTEAEIVLETYLAIVRGARGVIWWACYQARSDHPENWESTKKLAAELARISPILLADDCNDKVALDPPDAPLDVLLKRHGGKRYLIAVNHSTKPIPKVTLILPGLNACRSHFDNRQVPVRDGRSFTETLAPYERRMYELE